MTFGGGKVGGLELHLEPIQGPNKASAARSSLAERHRLLQQERRGWSRIFGMQNAFECRDVRESGKMEKKSLVLTDGVLVSLKKVV